MFSNIFIDVFSIFFEIIFRGAHRVLDIRCEIGDKGVFQRMVKHTNERQASLLANAWRSLMFRWAKPYRNWLQT